MKPPSEEEGGNQAGSLQEAPGKRIGGSLAISAMATLLLASLLLPLLLLLLLHVQPSEATSAIRLEQDSNAYTGLTFTFDPRLDKRVDGLHFEHWHSIVQHSSGLLYEALRGRAHLGEVRVLIPYKWRQYNWPILHKQGALANRRLLHADSDVIVGFEDPIYKETPFAVQHDECARPGLNIRMPVSFLEQQSPMSARLKARQLVREFAAHRYGIFKESGFRHDPMYPPFSSLAGLPAPLNQSRRALARAYLDLPLASTGQSQSQNQNQNQSGEGLGEPEGAAVNIRGFDENWNECAFGTNPANGLPAGNVAMGCLPYLSKTGDSGPLPSSFNLMSSDPFSYGLAESAGSRQLGAAGFRQLAGASQQAQPVEWRELADSASWHFCGENFPASQPLTGSGPASGSSKQLGETQQHQQGGQRPSRAAFPHNQLTSNKQNLMCQERSAMEVIKASEDFRRNSFSPSTFNLLPATNFKFLQEMPPRIILCVEYAAHLYQSRRLDHQILEAAITKFLAYDLMADSELALVLFGQQFSNRNNFRKLEQSVSSRLTLYSPPLDPFEEPARMYTELELSQLDIQAAHSQSAKLVKGTCSFAKLMAEAMALQLQRNSYDDVGTDIIIVTTGLFVEDESKIEEIIRQTGSGRLEALSFNLIVYPSTMLFDTKSRDGYVVLDARESETIIRARLAKLHLIQRLTNAKVHLVKEHLDANGDVKMSTLTQFHQIFEHISKGHSWDQTHSMVTLSQQPVEGRPLEVGQATSGRAQSKLTFQFQLDNSLQNSELIVGFIDPKHRGQQQQRSGKRFAIRNLELRSPGNQLVLTDSHPFPVLASNHPLSRHGEGAHEISDSPESLIEEPQEGQSNNNLASADSALFAYRSQLNLAGFHLKPAHLALLHQHNQSAPLRLAGVWTLTATSDEPIQTSGVAMAQVDPSGDTLTATCWIQTYYEPSADLQETSKATSGSSALKTVKVFMQVKGAPNAMPAELQGRLEVQDELGNIVQNVNMLDDGLGTPDMTHGDGIYSQYVQRSSRSGYYKASIELTGDNTNKAPRSQASQISNNQPGSSNYNGQDNACCGSSMSGSGRALQDTRFLTRQLYCGTFFVEAGNKLGLQRPPRVNNLTVANVDQENRRVTLRWFEPELDLTSANQLSGRLESMSGDEISGGELEFSEHSGAASTAKMLNARAHGKLDTSGDELEATSFKQPVQVQQNPLTSRYEIKLFSDREAMKRAFDSKLEVGFRFHDINIEGLFANATNYGGLKEITLRVPQKQEGIYYIAMRVYNNLGASSQMSNIVQFYLKNNLTSEDLEVIYGQATTVDAEGNVYDKNGELIQRAGGFALANGQTQFNSLLKGTNGLDGISVMVFIGVIAFVVSVLCISLTACIASSAKSTLNKMQRHHCQKSEDKKAVAKGIAGAGSGSSMVSSGCGSSQQSEVPSSSSSSSSADCGGSHNGHDVEISKLSMINDELHPHSPMANFNHLQQTHLNQQQQAQLIGSQLMAGAYDNQHMTYQSPQHQAGQFAEPVAMVAYQPQQFQSVDKSAWMPQHTMVNGYAYATIMQQHQQHGDLNQNGLTSPVQSWPSEVLLSHYDKVKQARDRNEGPPVMRLETLEKQPFNELGLPIVDELTDKQNADQQNYLVRQKRNQLPSYFNQQLQQQLSSVLKTKRTTTTSTHLAGPLDEGQGQVGAENSTPALEGLTDSQFGLDPQSFLEQQHQMAPPPPQYLYGTSSGASTEPNLYSQMGGNLQQVAGQLDQQSYYANQEWQVQQQQQQQQLMANSEEQIYSTSGQLFQQQHQHQHPEEALSSSAISEV